MKSNDDDMRREKAANSAPWRKMEKRRSSLMSDAASGLEEPSIHEPDGHEESSRTRRRSTMEPLESMAPPRAPRRKSKADKSLIASANRPRMYRDKMNMYSRTSSKGSDGMMGSSLQGFEAAAQSDGAGSRNHDGIFNGDSSPDEGADQPLQAPGAVSISMSDEGEIIDFDHREKCARSAFASQPSARSTPRLSRSATSAVNGDRRSTRRDYDHLRALQEGDGFSNFSDEPSYRKGQKQVWWKTTWFKILIAVLLTAGITMVVVSFVGKSSNEETSAPTEDAAMDIEARREAAKVFLSTFSDPVLLDQDGSPQRMAFEWIVNEDQVTKFQLDTLGENLEKMKQRYILSVFFFATGGLSDWISTRNWLDGQIDECDWRSVTCNPFGEVTSIDTGANGNRLIGTIPNEIGFLSLLNSLSLPSNKISEISSGMESLSNLALLRLGNNDISGTMPSVIYAMHSLEHLDIGGNLMSGTIDREFSNLSKLTVLDLSLNGFSGILPIETFKDLKEIDLGTNSFEGNVTQFLTMFRSLEYLDLSRNKMTGFLPSEIGILPGLSGIVLDHMELSSTIPSEIGTLTHLKTLALSANELTGTLPIEIRYLSNLESLLLNFNQLGGPIPQTICDLRPPDGKLEQFAFDRAKFSCQCLKGC